MRWALLSAVALLPGCGAPLLTAAFVVVAVQHERSVAGGSLGATPDATAVGTSRASPELAPDRRINEVDCTQPVDWSRGNIRCK